MQPTTITYTMVTDTGYDGRRRRVRFEPVPVEPDGWWRIEEEYVGGWRECGRELVRGVHVETDEDMPPHRTFRGPGDEWG